MSTQQKARKGRPPSPIREQEYPVRLREIRESKGLRQVDLAEYLGLPQPCISEAERTGKGLGDEKWERLAKLLETDVLTLRGWQKIYAEL